MRDDEWVFSGYSFTDMVWIDAAGRLHEGPVPAEQASALGGAGFYHRVSRDAFIALWLEHTAKGFDGLKHGGVPTLHYLSHGQLWSRYPASRTKITAGMSFRQKNAYLVARYPDQDAAKTIQAIRHQLLNPLAVRTEMPGGLAGAVPSQPPLARYGETPSTAPHKTEIWKALRQVQDEQFYTIDANIVDLGYVYDVRERAGVVHVVLTMPHRGRPVYDFLVSQGGGRVSEGIRERVLKLPGIRDVVIDFTWEPPWTPARLTDAARKDMGLPV
jgi:metal-sulfur cluster biosynthetic enzyme